MTKTKTFEIVYVDPETQERETVQKTFTDSKEFPAEMQADDFAYTKADKGWYRIKELHK